MSKFIKISDAIVAQPAANLEWAVQLLCEGKRAEFAEAEAACTALDLGGYQDWRLPTVEELFLLADRTKVDPAIDQEYFPETPAAFTWSSTPYADNPADYAWGVSFDDGGTYIAYRNYTGFVRAVRSVSPAAPGQ